MISQWALPPQMPTIRANKANAKAFALPKLIRGHLLVEPHDEFELLMILLFMLLNVVKDVALKRFVGTNRKHKKSCANHYER